MYVSVSILISMTANSSFCDLHHKHKTTKYLKIIKNSKLRKLLTKNQNYREPQRINFSKALIELIETVADLDTCMEAVTLILDKYTTSNLKQWKEKVLAKVKEKITELKK